MKKNKKWPDKRGYFGPFGGQYVPETLWAPLDEMQKGYEKVHRSKQFRKELDSLLRLYAGRPTPLFEAKQLSKRVGARVFLKREDLAHTGAHKINNTLGQCLLAKHLGEETNYLRNRGGPTRRGHSLDRGSFGLNMCCVYGA